MLRCIWLLVASAAMVSACAVHQPGQGVTPQVAASYGCSYAAVMQRAKEVKADLGPGKVWIPQVGWDACELLARNGRPTRVDHHQTEYGRRLSWWYQTQYDAHLITLEYRPGRGSGSPWVVTYVGW